MKLRALRVNVGLTQKEAAEKLGISPSMLGSYERGESMPNVVMIKKFEALYNTRYEDIDFLCSEKTI